ncbi:MAG: diadenylate cyclase CdaA [Planctomycetota bacterium]|nr:diadenylate cyclase CdaA [Planctomycetota bacterium]
MWLVKDAVEIAILFAIIYTVLRFLRGTKGAGIFRGVALLLVALFLILYYISIRFDLERMNYLLHRFLEAALFGLIIVFQPELRRGLVRLGQTPIFGHLLRSGKTVIEEIERAVLRLSRNRVGAIIVLQRDVSLSPYLEGGVKIDAKVSAELLESVFYPGSSLHDGATIVVNDRIAAAGCLLPLSENPKLGLGTRHRAAVGVTEDSDAVAIVVSEETGAISIAVGGELERNLDKPSLEKRLRELYAQKEEMEKGW